MGAAHSSDQEKEEVGQKTIQWVTAPRNHRNCLTTFFSAHGKGQKKHCTEPLSAQQPGSSSTLRGERRKKTREPTVEHHEALRATWHD